MNVYRCSGRSGVLPDLGMAYFEAQRWEEAAVVLHAVALARSEASLYAAPLAIEAMSALAETQKRDECRAELLPLVSFYRASLCESPGASQASRDGCRGLAAIEAELAKR